MSAPGIAELVQRSSFIFAGTVQQVGRSSLRVLPPRPDLAVVKFEHGFLVNVVLGKLDGRPITVKLGQAFAAADTAQTERRFVFFTTAWVHGEEIAVSELGRLEADKKTEEEVAQAVAMLPELHLNQRIASAVLIVHGTVADIARATNAPRTGSEHDPFWQSAVIEVRDVLKGKLATQPAKSRRGRAILLFPGTRDLAFRDTPRPRVGQEAVFLLHEAAAPLPPDAHVAPDPADIQPPGSITKIRSIVDASGG